MNKENRLLRIGVLGCGPISQAAHFDACRKARNAELYAICDRAPDLLEAMAATHHPQVTYRDYDAMLADPQLEAVIIGVADQFHVPLAIKAIRAGKPVLVEKPLGVNIEEGEQLCDLVHKSGLVFQVGNNKRFDPGITFARRFIQEELGQHMALKAWYCDSIYRYSMTDNLQPVILGSPDALRPEGNPKADKRRYYMLTHGSHLVDTARYLFGDIVKVQAKLVERFEAYCWFISVDFVDGSVGHLDLIVAVRGDWEEGFQVFGEYGSVKARTFLPWFHKSSEVECFSTRDGLYRRPLGEDAYTYKLQIESFAESILRCAPLRGASVDDGLAAMRVMAAIARSVENGDAVCPADVFGHV